MKKMIQKKKLTKIALLILIITSLVACGNSTKFIDDGSGHKQYKDSDGNFVKDSWVELNGNNYYFDLNGYLVTSNWVQNEYYVDETGKMKKNYWVLDNNANYYVGEDGKYVRNKIIDIDNKTYGFDNNGLQVRSQVFSDGTVAYYFDEKGNIDKTSGYKNIGDTNCYVNEDGEAIINQWKEYDGEWYYYGENGLMLKNSFVHGGYYVNEFGAMIKNKEIKIGNDTYVFDNEGIGKIKTTPKLNMIQIKNKCCSRYKDGKAYDGSDSMLKATATNDELEITAEYPFKSEGLNWAKLINNELGLSSSIYNRMSKTEAGDGVQSVKEKGITVVWKVNSEGRGGFWGNELEGIEISYSLN